MATAGALQRRQGTVRSQRRIRGADATSTSDRTSRLFPIPASPTTETTAGRPPSTPTNKSVNWLSSRRRPTSGISPGADWCASLTGRTGSSCGTRLTISGSWRSIASSKRRRPGPGSAPSSSASCARTCRRAANASACRPAAANATAWTARNVSRKGCARTSGSSSPGHNGLLTQGQPQQRPVLQRYQAKLLQTSPFSDRCPWRVPQLAIRGSAPH